MSTLRYSVTVQFDVCADEPQTVQEKLTSLAEIGHIASVKAKSAGKEAKEDVGE
jgi:hypothetical protein